jgi:hypothetical protein
MGVAAERLFDAPRLLMNRSSTGLSPIYCIFGRSGKMRSGYDQRSGNYFALTVSKE